MNEHPVILSREDGEGPPAASRGFRIFAALRMTVVLLALPLAAQQSRLASDFEIAQMEKQLSTAHGFEAQLSARLNLGDARSARNERSLAREEYARALTLATRERLDARRESSMTRYAIATSYAALAQGKLGRDAEAFALLEESVRYTSNDPETWNLYASAMRNLGHPRKAVAAARNAVAIVNPEKKLDLAIYQHSLASMLVEANELDEAERLLLTVTRSLESPAFDLLRREVARGESFEVHSSARGDVAAYVSLLNRAQLRLASLYERRGAKALARQQYERVLAARTDDATALAGLARLAGSNDEREQHYAEAFDANPFSMALVREYQRYLRSHVIPSEVEGPGRVGGAPPEPPGPSTQPVLSGVEGLGMTVRKVLIHLARGQTRSARALLDGLIKQFPQNETLRILRREAEQKPAALPSANPSAAELRALLDGFEQLTPEQRVALDTMTFVSAAKFEGGEVAGGQTILEKGTIEGMPFRFATPMVFTGAFDTTIPLQLTYRIAGVSGSALLLEPENVR